MGKQQTCKVTTAPTSALPSEDDRLGGGGSDFIHTPKQVDVQDGFHETYLACWYGGGRGSRLKLQPLGREKQEVRNKFTP